ncbi:MAG: hypothetical protein HWE22_09590 [Flavobacteriales bacterium]|nr:hypothetical protein [Flavobacteriales bacterium]
MPITNTISVETATEWVNRWKESEHTLVNDDGTFIKGFFIPGDDLNEVMRETGASDARSYLGIDDNHEFHLLVVGVDDNGNDMVDPEKGCYVYDFTRPCPPTCSKTGPFK